MVDFTYVNAALTRVGSPQISSYDEGSSGPKIAQANYEIVVLDELSRYPWKWATLTLDLGAPIEGSPRLPWTYARLLPYPTIRVRSITVEGIDVDYEIQSDKLLSLQDSTVTVVATAVWRRPETYWPPYFGELITLRMMQIFLRGIGERYEEAADLEKSIQHQRGTARLADTQSMPPSDPWKYPLLEARVA